MCFQVPWVEATAPSIPHGTHSLGIVGPNVFSLLLSQVGNARPLNALCQAWGKAFWRWEMKDLKPGSPTQPRFCIVGAIVRPAQLSLHHRGLPFMSGWDYSKPHPQVLPLGVIWNGFQTLADWRSLLTKHLTWTSCNTRHKELVRKRVESPQVWPDRANLLL